MIIKPEQKMNIFSKTGVAFLSIILILSAIFVLNREQEKPVKQKPSGAYEALNFLTKIRSYPDKSFPSGKYFNEFKKAKKLNKISSITEVNVEQWEPLGPKNVPGRMISVTVNPQNPLTLYAGSASGGLWRTFRADEADHWEKIETGFPVLGVMAIAINPLDTNIMYIGTGEVYGYQKSDGGLAIRTTRGSYGIGILKTTDGGATWTKSLDWSLNEERGIQDIAINPLNPSTIFAATTEGIYKSEDGGETWENMLEVVMGEDIVINRLDTNKILVSCGNFGTPNAGIYKSIDAGTTWFKINGIPSFTGKTLMDAYYTDPNLVFASVADSLSGIGLYKSEDFGDSWTLVNDQNVPRYQGFFAHWVAVHPTDANKIIYAGVDIYRSSDGGSSLIYINNPPHVDHHNYAHDPQNPGTIYISCDGGVYRSTNFGVSFQNIGTGLQTAQFYKKFSTSYQDSNFAIGGLQDNNTVLFFGNSYGWQRVIGGDGCCTAINPGDDNIVFGEYQYNNIQKSTNRGSSFTSATSGMTADAPFVAPYAIAESNPSVMYSGRTIVYKTVNGAENWFGTNNNNELDGNYVIALGIAPQNENIVYAATAPTETRAHVFKSADGGENWTNVTNSLPNRYPMEVAVDPQNENVAYVVFGGFGSGHVFKTTNGGASWTDVTGTLPDVPTFALIIDPLNPDHLYVGNDIGVYFSDDGGNSWNQFTDGLPEAVIAMDLNISRSNRKLRVATHGNGVYERPLVYTPDFLVEFHPAQIPSQVLLGQELTFSASLNNLGSQAQSDTFKVEVKVFDESDNELFSSTKYICCLSAKENRHFAFEDTFVPLSIGNYKVQYKRYPTTQLTTEETITQNFEVIETPTIVNSSVSKVYRPYVEITDGTNLGQGDDTQTKINLPFNFVYDYYTYDKIQISTNGWLEFGAGSDGTTRGLSTESQIGQIGANENGRLASTERPNKALGPWWEDLNTTGGGNLSYKISGTSPDRVLTVQWQNMLAYYDAGSTTTRVNFQVKLYETSNKIEFCYGPVTKGTFDGPDIGAMIGFKDHIGGDYHFYDVYQNKLGTAVTLRTDLSPLTDWPGPDSVFVIETTVTSINDNPDKIPGGFVLYQNYPNPFNPSTTIKYTLPVLETLHATSQQLVQLKVYDVLGREVATLVNEKQSPGNYEVTFNAVGLPSGIYFYKLKTDKFVKTQKMILLK